MTPFLVQQLDHLIFFSENGYFVTEYTTFIVSFSLSFYPGRRLSYHPVFRYFKAEGCPRNIENKYEIRYYNLKRQPHFLFSEAVN